MKFYQGDSWKYIDKSLTTHPTSVLAGVWLGWSIIVDNNLTKSL